MTGGHTPEQAAALWCPMVRTVRWETDTVVDSSFAATADGTAHAIGGCNSGGMAARNPKSSRCIAGSCAMWRWETYYAPPLGAEPGKLVEGVLHRAGTGFCGLAGFHVQVDE